MNENEATELQDKYGNKIIVPEGFKIASASARDVTGGVVIEEVSDRVTAGSQFVWIPVGKIYVNEEKTKKQAPRGTLSKETIKEEAKEVAKETKAEKATTVSKTKPRRGRARNTDTFEYEYNDIPDTGDIIINVDDTEDFDD